MKSEIAIVLASAGLLAAAVGIATSASASLFSLPAQKAGNMLTLCPCRSSRPRGTT